MPARDMAKARANLAAMPDIRLEIMDLLDPGSINAFASQFRRDNESFTSWSTMRGSWPLRLRAMRAGKNLNFLPTISVPSNTLTTLTVGIRAKRTYKTLELSSPAPKKCTCARRCSTRSMLPDIGWLAARTG